MLEKGGGDVVSQGIQQYTMRIAHQLKKQFTQKTLNYLREGRLHSDDCCLSRQNVPYATVPSVTIAIITNC